MDKGGIFSTLLIHILITKRSQAAKLLSFSAPARPLD